jgi:transposase
MQRTAATALPNNIAALKALVRQHEMTIATLSEQLQLMLARRFGASSERVAEAQLGLFNEAEAELDTAAEEDIAPAIEVPAHTRKVPKRKPLSKDLPRVEVIHDLPEDNKLCPHDGTVLVPMGSADSEQLDIIPATVHVLLHKRLKYVCPCCNKTLLTAPMTPQPIPKSQASPGLLAYVATAKYVDGLPLYRQIPQFARLGLDCSRTTLARWMIHCGGSLTQPMINLLRDELLEQDYIQCDETRTQVLKEPGEPAHSTSYMWLQRSGNPQRPIVLFDYDSSRSGQVPQRLLDGFHGILQTDAYSGYNAVVRAQKLIHALCMAHARRYYTDALKAKGIHPNRMPAKAPKGCEHIFKALAFFKALYAIERRIREMTPDEKTRIRDRETRPILNQFKLWLDRRQPKVLPSSKLGQAIAYTLNQWSGLTRFCDDGRIAIDNNGAENALRPFCLGRKNWMFSDTVAGARASANLYSLIETAKANGIEPYAYLRHLFTELPKATCVEDYEALLPYRLDPNVLTRRPS